MNFPTVHSALDYVQSKISDFYGQRKIILARIKAIHDLTELAKKTGDTAALSKLSAMRTQAVGLLGEQLKLEDQLKPFAEYFGFSTAPTLGALPVVLLAAAAGAASLLYLHFERLQTQKQALDMVSKGMISASEAEAIVNPGLLKTLVGGGGFGGLGVFAVVGVGLYVYLTMWRR